MDYSQDQMRNSLIQAATRYVEAEGGGEGYYRTPVNGVHVMRSFRLIDSNHSICTPSLCIVLRGAKEILYGDQTLRYGAMHCLVAGIEVPSCGRLVEASPDEPYLGMTIDIDVAMMRDVLAQIDPPPLPTSYSGLFVVDVTRPFAESALRLLNLVNTPEAIPVLAAPILRELYYWLLTGPQGGRICGLALPDSHMDRIGRAIVHLRRHYAERVSVNELAAVAAMSSSSFRSHFKSLTATSPIQFQKHLRLLEARRLMLAESANVTQAAFQVGYSSTSQFSRDYSRTFGAAPKRDVAQARAEFA